MKFIHGYNSFRLTKVNEQILFGQWTLKATVQMQMKKAFAQLPEKISAQTILKWVSSTLLNTKSDSFIIYPLIEEFKISGGKGGSVLPGKYHGIQSTVEPPTNDYQDIVYYKFMENIFSSQVGILSDPNDVKSPGKVDSFSGNKSENRNSGLFWIEQECQKQFEDNPLPFAIIKYCIKRVRAQVAKEISFIPTKNRNWGDDNISNIFKPYKSTFNQKDKKQVESEEEDKIPGGCFVNENPINHIPELKSILLKVGFRDVDDPKKSPADRAKAYEPIRKKKRDAFCNYFKTSVYQKFELVVKSIKEGDIEKYLKERKIDVQSGKQSFSKDDVVVYLKKGKTIKDWNDLKDFQKAELDNSDTKEVVSTGTIVEVQEDDQYQIMYQDGKFAIKSSNEIIKKIDKPEEDEEEEDKKEDKKEEDKSSQKEPEVQKPTEKEQPEKEQTKS